MPDPKDTALWPFGTIALVFTDVERSTELWQIDEEAFGQALMEHDDILRETLARHQGVEVKHTGDGFFVVFSEVPAAASFCLELQGHLLRHEWPEELGPVRTRIGLHRGRARLHGADYRGPAVNLAARVCNACSGGQILVSGAAADQLWSVPGLPDRLVDLGRYSLAGVPEPVQVYELRGQSQMEFDIRPLGAGEPAALPEPSPEPSPTVFDEDDDDRWQRIKLLLRQADNAQAIGELAVLHQRHPSDVKVLTTLGVAYGVEEQLDAAERCFREALELAPNHAAAWFNLARVYGKMGRRDQIGHALAMALRADPKHPKARAVAAKYGVEIPELTSEDF